MRLRTEITLPGSLTLDGYNDIVEALNGLGSVEASEITKGGQALIRFEWEPETVFDDDMPTFALSFAIEQYKAASSTAGTLNHNAMLRAIACASSAVSQWEEIKAHLRRNGIDEWTAPMVVEEG